MKTVTNAMLFFLVVFLSGLALITPLAWSAADLHVWVGFSEPRSHDVRGPRPGDLWYGPVLVGSNETEPAPQHWVRIDLYATGPGGFQCHVDATLTTKIKPAATMPVRFQVFYPEGKTGTRPPVGPKGVPPQLARQPKVDYTLTAKVRVADPGSATAENRFTFKFPEGGKPECRKLN